MRLPRPSLATAAIAAIVATTALPAVAAGPDTIDFEGVTSYASVANYYNGGSDGAGAVGAQNLGVSFSGAALALANDPLGPYFANAPTPGTVLFATDSSAYLDAAAGFTGSVSFWYSALTSALDGVTLWSGTDGAGTLLGSLGLGANAQIGGCTSAPLCNWQQVSLSFAGTAHSIGFGGNAGNVAFDNITITAAVNPVPEPATASLLALGVAGVWLSVRRRRNDHG